jgi:hypothetical protein
MDTRNVAVTLEKTREWYNSENAALKETALQVFGEIKLLDNDMAKYIDKTFKRYDRKQYDYWDTCTQKIIDKYVRAMREARVIFSDITIGYHCCYAYKTFELKRRCTEATKIYISLHKEIDKFPKRNRGIIYSALKKFKL